MLRSSLLLIVTVGIVAGLRPTRLAAQSACPDSIPTDFLTLADFRGSVNADVSNLERAIQRLEATLPQAESLATSARRFTESAARDTLALKERVARDTAAVSRLLFLRSNIQRAIADQAAPSASRDSLKILRTQLDASRKLAACVQGKIAALLNPDQRFKRDMSAVYAVLIGIVILGFFALSWKDASLRDRIFAGQGGIQFLTLFSLVIAIILFGIIGILEGKELAALLGGLSGYILGRSSPDGPAPPSPTP